MKSSSYNITIYMAYILPTCTTHNIKLLEPMNSSPHNRNRVYVLWEKTYYMNYHNYLVHH